MFNRHRQMVESGERESEYSKLHFFLTSITDRSEEINKYMNNASLCPIDITQLDFSQRLEVDQLFEPHHLDLVGENKEIMTKCVFKALKYTDQVSNVNIVRNADGLLSRREKEVLVD